MLSRSSEDDGVEWTRGHAASAVLSLDRAAVNVTNDAFEEVHAAVGDAILRACHR